MTLTETQDSSALNMAEDHHHDDAISTKGLIGIYATLLLVVALWGLSIFTWGVPGLYMPAVCFVPVMYALLIIISKG